MVAHGKAVHIISFLFFTGLSVSSLSQVGMARNLDDGEWCWLDDQDPDVTKWEISIFFIWAYLATVVSAFFSITAMWSIPSSVDAGLKKRFYLFLLYPICLGLFTIESTLHEGSSTLPRRSNFANVGYSVAFFQIFYTARQAWYRLFFSCFFGTGELDEFTDEMKRALSCANCPKNPMGAMSGITRLVGGLDMVTSMSDSRDMNLLEDQDDSPSSDSATTNPISSYAAKDSFNSSARSSDLSVVTEVENPTNQSANKKNVFYLEVTKAP
jgi:hypothetical protein